MIADTFFSSITALQNTNGDPINNKNFDEYAWTAKRAQVTLGIAKRDDLEWLADWVRANVTSVRNEITHFRSARQRNPVELARRCFLFAIVSPQCKFAENVLATQNLMREFDQLDDLETTIAALRVPYNGTGNMRLVNLGKTKAAYIIKAIPWLRSLTPDNIDLEFTYDRILSMTGMGDKTSSMAMALYDDTSNVFTLDTWMLRLTLALSSHEFRSVIATTTAGYKLTSSDWLAWHERCLPDCTPFETQWTLWNGCFGHHVSHLGILSN